MTQVKHSGSLIGKIGSYLQIITKDPHSTAFVPLAEAYRQIGLLDDALEAANLGTKMLPHFSPGFATQGRILGQMGRIDEAMLAYAKALSIDPQSQSALIGLARLHLIRAERDQARKVLVQATQFHPYDESIKNMLAALDLPRPWAAIQQVPEVQEVVSEQANSQGEDPFSPIPTATLAEIYVKQGLIEKAIKVYRILALDPKNKSARERLSQLSGELKTIQGPGDVSLSKDELSPGLETPKPSTPLDQIEANSSSEKQSVRSTLERWLVAIRERKAHV